MTMFKKQDFEEIHCIELRDDNKLIEFYADENDDTTSKVFYHYNDAVEYRNELVKEGKITDDYDVYTYSPAYYTIGIAEIEDFDNGQIQGYLNLSIKPFSSGNNKEYRLYYDYYPEGNIEYNGKECWILDTVSTGINTNEDVFKLLNDLEFIDTMDDLESWLNDEVYPDVILSVELENTVEE